jgi:hypothetical protein
VSTSSGTPDGDGSDRLARRIFQASILLAVLGGVFLAGLYSGATRNALYRLVWQLRENVRLVVEDTSLTGEPIHFLQPARQPGSGVTVNERAGEDGLVLLAGFFDGGNELRLVRRDGTPVRRWPVRFSEHFPETDHLALPPQSDLNVDLHGALVTPDGSVVFNYEYGGLVKLSRCGEVEWTLAHPVHHSVERAEAGGYWVPGREYLYPDQEGKFPPFTRLTGETVDDYRYDEDYILRVSEEGEILEAVSIPQILYDSGLEPVLTATGYGFAGAFRHLDREIVHVNKIAELPAAMAGAFPGLEAGDLMLSMREYNLVVIVDPETWRVRWHQTGPWRRQHDPEFTPDGRIAVFNNNAYTISLGAGWGSRWQSDPEAPRVSNIVLMDPATREWEVAYGGREGQEFLTVLRGKHEALPGGGFLVTEFEAGRVFEVDAEGRLVWEYINRYDDDRVLEITEARLYPSSYFTVPDWNCPDRG